MITYRNAICKALGLALVATSLSAAADKPGTYIVQSRLDDPFCRRVQRILSAGELPGNKAGRRPDPNFIAWNAVNMGSETARDVEPEELQKAEADVDNDGRVDSVFRWKASMSGSKTPTMYIVSAEEGKTFEQGGLELRPLSQASRHLFVNGSVRIQSVQKKLGNDQDRWNIGWVSSLEIFRHGENYYLVASYPDAPLKLSNEALVVQLLPGDEAKGIRMLRRACPCSGCSDVHRESPEQLFPSSQWCARK